MKIYLLAASVALLTALAPQAHAQTRRAAKNTPGAPAMTMPAGSSTAPDNTPAPPADPNGKLDYRNPAADPLIPVEADKRKPVTDDLQATVVELLELFHDSKQSHWNLRGPLYLPLHEKLQENADEYRKYADILAERVLQVGNPIDGRTGVVAATANLGEFPGGYLTDKQVLIIMTERITTVAKRVRQRIEHLSKVDEVTSNQLQELSYVLDKHVWQFRVHMQ
ncbi:DNA starvation/stationary phase protection protein [Hymenobacter sp. BRD128]|uniref:Dps family protein n=1 Tax=Hymenobacter sp. BRD128 TaxID=2675878 RepID=UPI001563F3E8|nr:DNA starvation/stationary phase protection protein [Hymenobacter sp. BRD128]QKG57922.1 DNA starvation/stationary phase protection protein [Hymenobacter sp. BRD128]